MKFSADRILTTHTGSLPRPPDLVALLNSKELGESYDRAAFSHRVGRAILEIMRRQADAGIDIVDDGEHSKVNWMAYARARLSGLEVALESVSVEEAFMTAISPSNLELYYENRYYASDQQYLVALADAMHISAAALGDGDALAQADARKTFVLIHGAYHGGWCWRKVVDILERRGHKVYAPSR
jgi:hypothetical protein